MMGEGKITETLGASAEIGEESEDIVETARGLLEEGLNRESCLQEEKLVTMLKTLESLDSNKIETLLNWVCLFQKEHFSKTLVANYKQVILDVFAEKGFYPNLHSTSEIPPSGSFESAKILVEINLYMFRQTGTVSTSLEMDIDFWISNRESK